MTATATRPQFDPVQARVARAQEALAAGRYSIWRKGSEGTLYRWTLKNGGGKTYTISYDRQQKSFTCTCPDFQKRGAQVGTCKHIEAVKIWERANRANGKTANSEKGATHDAPCTTHDLAALIAAIREQNEILRLIAHYLRSIAEHEYEREQTRRIIRAA